MSTGTGSRRAVALGVLSAGTLMIILSETIVNVALRSIQNDLGFSQSGLAWVVNAYLIAFGGLLLLAGRLGDLIGHRRVFLAGLALFTASSLASGLATTPAVLITTRFVQGVGAALTASVILGMIVTLYPEPRLRARAFGVYSFVGAAGASIGVLAGGVLTQILNWHWVFFVNVPIGVAAIALSLRVLRPDRGLGLGAGADVTGATLVTAGLMLAVYTIVGTTDHGWATPGTLVPAATAAALLAGFVVRQATARRPLLPLRLFRSRQVSGANLVQALTVSGMFGFQFLSGLYLQRVLHYGPGLTGLAYLPITLGIATVSLTLTARLMTRFAPRSVLLTGLALLTTGLALLSRVPVHGHYLTDVLPAMLTLGIGAGLALPPITTLAMSGATESDSGLASGLANTTQQVGGAIGLAALAALATAHTNHLTTNTATSQTAALTQGYRLAFATGAALLLTALVLTAALLPRTRRAKPDRPELNEEPNEEAKKAAKPATEAQESLTA